MFLQSAKRYKVMEALINENAVISSVARNLGISLKVLSPSFETRDKDFSLHFDVQGCTSAVGACDRHGWRKVGNAGAVAEMRRSGEMTHNST